MLWLGLAGVGGLLLRLGLFDFESLDYRLFLSRWYDFFLEQGRWWGLGKLNEQFCSYPPLYMYLISLGTLLPLHKLYWIKLTSILADYVAAWYVFRLVRRLTASDRKAAIAAVGFLLLPTVVMNSALWGQCDAMYTCGFVASLFYLVEARPAAAMVAFGFSCSLKPQAIFWCPLVAALLMSGRIPWKWMWVPWFVYVGCGVPQMLAGRPISNVLNHWGRVDNAPGLTLGAPNWYQWVSDLGNSDAYWWTGIAMTLFATTLFVIQANRGSFSPEGVNRRLVSLALLSVLFPPFLLPGMHDRYFFAADVLSVVYAVCSRGGWRVTVLIQCASALSYLPYLFNWEPVPCPLLALAVLAAMGVIIHDLFHRAVRESATKEAAP